MTGDKTVNCDLPKKNHRHNYARQAHDEITASYYFDSFIDYSLSVNDK